MVEAKNDIIYKSYEKMKEKKVMDCISFKYSWKEKNLHTVLVQGAQSFGSESGKCPLQK